MLQIFMAPQTEPGYLTLQAADGTWHAMIATLDQRNELALAEQIRAELSRQGAPPPRSLRLPVAMELAGTGPVRRVRLPEPQARAVLSIAGVNA